MPLYMTAVIGPEGQTPPPEMFEAVENMAKETAKLGVLVEFGGLMPTKMGVRAAIKDGKVVFTDGPFAESKEVFGGYAIYDLPNIEEAKKWSKHFLELHHRIWPAFIGTVEIREVVGREVLKAV